MIRNKKTNKKFIWGNSYGEKLYIWEILYMWNFIYGKKEREGLQECRPSRKKKKKEKIYKIYA